MLDKFENHDKDLGQGDPRFQVMDAWASFVSSYWQNLDQLRSVCTELMVQRLTVNPDLNFQIEAERRLQEEAPELNESTNRLRHALDQVTGWGISWRQYERGDAIAIDTSEVIDTEVDEALVIARVVRGPAQYPLSQGWIVGSDVGFDDITGSVNAWVEVSPEPEADRGSHFQLATMRAIELTPPT